MKVVLRILKWLGILLAGLALLVVTALAVFWWQPEILLNEKRARQALHYALAGTEVSWKSFRWDFAREGFLGKRSDLALGELCFRMGKEISGCAPEVRLDISFSLRHFKLEITRVGALVADITWLRYHPAPPAEPEEKSAGPLPDLRAPSFDSLYPSALEPGKLGEVRLRIGQLTMIAEKGPNLVASFALEKEKSDPGTAFFKIQGTANQGPELSLLLKGKGETVPSEQKLMWSGNLEGIANGWRIKLPFEATLAEKTEIRARPSLTKGQDHFTSPVAIGWEATRLTLDLPSLEFVKLWPKKRVTLNNCHLESRLDPAKGYPRQSDLRCDLALLSLARGALLPPMKAKLNASLALKPLDGDSVAASLQFHELGQNNYLESRIDLSGDARLQTAKGELEGDPKFNFNAKFRVPSVQNWKSALDRTPFALPAPFRTLAGPLSLDLKLDHVDSNELVILADLRTDLRGGRQVMFTSHQLRITLINPWRGKKSLGLTVMSELTDVALEAPPLNLENPPQPFPDTRFKRTSIPLPAGSAQSSIPLDWQVKVTTKAPFRIRTNLLEEEIPLAVNLRFAQNEDMQGTVRVQPMQVAVFKKKAMLQNVDLTFRDGSKVGEVDGLLITRNPEVTVKIMLLGSTEKPRVEFESDPPLNRQQIVGVLLFNKSVSELNEDEASSASSFSQATADGALGLFSLLFLSNTPIQSISYDPVSQTYAAKVIIGDKTTMSVGSDFDRERQVALRRRLGGRWSIRTELHDQEGRPDVMLTLLEWFKRF